MAPLFNFLSRRKRGGLQAVPLYIRVVCRFLSEQVKRRRMYPSASTRSIGVEAFRVDAEAEGDAIRIGGWLPTRVEDRRIATEASPWFAIELDRRSAPRAYHRGDPSRTKACSNRMCTGWGRSPLRGLPFSGTSSNIDSIFSRSSWQSGSPKGSDPISPRASSSNSCSGFLPTRSCNSSNAFRRIVRTLRSVLDLVILGVRILVWLCVAILALLCLQAVRGLDHLLVLRGVLNCRRTRGCLNEERER